MPSLPEDHLTWRDTEQTKRHPVDGRARVEVKIDDQGATRYRALSDAGADAAISMAANAESRLSFLSNQLLATTALNATLTGGLATFATAQDGDPTPVAIALLAAGAAFYLTAERIDSAMRYYFGLASSAAFLARKHYRIGIIHADADAAYAAALSKAEGLFKHQSSRAIALANLAIPVASGLFLMLDPFVSILEKLR